MVKKILVATDGSSHAKKAVAFAGDFASRYDASVKLVHVVQEDRMPDEMKELFEVEHLEKPPKRAYMETVGKKILEDAKKELSGKGIKDIELVLLVGDAPEEIVAFAKKENIDVIIIGNKGFGKIKELLIGSVTHKVFHAAHCTCITVK
jgi:nucleotide-binding universal stress UspA family protein